MRGVRMLQEELERRESQRGFEDEVLKSVDIHALLDHYGARNVQEETPFGEVVHSCLLDSVQPHHKNRDEHPSASINVNSGLYACYAFGGGSLLWLIQMLEGCNRKQAVRFLRDFLANKDGNVETLLQTISKAFSEKEKVFLPVYSPKVLDRWKETGTDYWEQRQISPEMVEQFSLCFDAQESRVVIPHFFKGNLVGWQKRALDPDHQPRYKSSQGFPKNETLFNYDRAIEQGSVVVTEGPLSAVRGVQFGHNVVATFGANITDDQIKLLRRFTTVTLYLDFDDAGMKGTLDVLKKLGDYTQVRAVFEKRDFADFDAEEGPAVEEVIAGSFSGPEVQTRLELGRL